jgi:hypothetical protein
MFRKIFSIGSTICVLALATLISSGCALIGLEEEEEETTTVATGSLSDIEGTWVSGCNTGTGGNPQIRTVTFSGTTYTHQQKDYGDTSCSSENYVVEATYNNLTAGSQTTLYNAESGFYLTATVQTLTWTMKTSTMANYANSQSICGITSWQPNEAVSIAGIANCGGSDQPSQGTAYTDKYKVSGTSLILENTQLTYTKQ